MITIFGWGLMGKIGMRFFRMGGGGSFYIKIN